MPSGYTSRRDIIPAEQISRHIVDYIKDHDRDIELPGYSVLEPLSERIGVDTSYLAKLVMDKQKFITFDYADLIFCGLGDPVRFWHSTPELQEAYETLASVADEVAERRSRRTPERRAYDRERSRIRRQREREKRLAVAA